MTGLRVHNVSLSLDGYAAGPGQSPEEPLGAGGKPCTSGSSRPAVGRRSTRPSCSAGSDGMAVVPVLLHGGERLFGGLGDAVDGWRCVEFAPSASVTHVRLRH